MLKLTHLFESIASAEQYDREFPFLMSFCMWKLEGQGRSPHRAAYFDRFISC